MKRTAFLLAALISLGVPAAGQARSVVAQRVHQSRAEVLQYWTAERMRSAQPVARAKPGGAGGPQSTYPFTSYEAPAPYTAFPTSTHGKVYFSDGGVNYVCSGNALTSANESLVWTAGHCVNQGPGSFFTNWMFVPAYRDGLRPFGTFTASSLMTTSQWQGSGNFAYDLGAAKVAPVNETSLTDTIGGGRGIQFNYARQRQYQAYGYPAAKKFSGQRLRICDAPWGLDDTSVSPATMGIGCDHTGGSSGGGWISGGNLYSVNSYGYGSLRNVMFGPYQGSVAQSLYLTAAS
jgi:hypothetical protein